MEQAQAPIQQLYDQAQTQQQIGLWLFIMLCVWFVWTGLALFLILIEFRIHNKREDRKLLLLEIEAERNAEKG